METVKRDYEKSEKEVEEEEVDRNVYVQMYVWSCAKKKIVSCSSYHFIYGKKDENFDDDDNDDGVMQTSKLGFFGYLLYFLFLEVIYLEGSSFFSLSIAFLEISCLKSEVYAIIFI